MPKPAEHPPSDENSENPESLLNCTNCNSNLMYIFQGIHIPSNQRYLTILKCPDCEFPRYEELDYGNYSYVYYKMQDHKKLITGYAEAMALVINGQIENEFSKLLELDYFRPEDF